MPHVDAHSPLKTLLALHQLVDNGIEPMLSAMGLDRSTESIMTVDSADLQALSGADDPQAVLVSVDPGPGLPALLIAEPALCTTILARIWRSKRGTGGAMTQVEGAILQQFLHDVVRQWRVAWQVEGIEVLPSFTMAGSLSMLGAQMPAGSWHVARTVVFDEDDAPAGVLLFCYPAELIPTLVEARESIRWRTRIERGLNDAEQAKLRETVGRFANLRIPAPVTLTTDVPLGVINELERGDVIALDAPVGADMQLSVLDRDVTARLARCNDNLALVLGGPLASAPFGGEEHEQMAQDPYDPYGMPGDAGADHPFDPQQSF